MNTSKVSKTIHGVVFKPGETKEVEKYINDPTFIRVSDLTKASTNLGTESKGKKSDTQSEVKK